LYPCDPFPLDPTTPSTASATSMSQACHKYLTSMLHPLGRNLRPVCAVGRTRLRWVVTSLCEHLRPPHTAQAPVYPSALPCCFFFFTSLALCSLLSVLCSLLSALCSLLSIRCSLLSVLCSLLSALCSLSSALCSLLSALPFLAPLCCARPAAQEHLPWRWCP
jgi:hypothetical protein